MDDLVGYIRGSLEEDIMSVFGGGRILKEMIYYMRYDFFCKEWLTQNFILFKFKLELNQFYIFYDLQNIACNKSVWVH